MTQTRKRACPVHDGQIHGGEAEELRHGLEQLIGNYSVTPRQVQALLDRVDARDSLAHGERASAVEAQLEQANALWRYWTTHDITENDDEWAAFSNAVRDHLDGKPVPERFVRSKP